MTAKDCRLTRVSTLHEWEVYHRIRREQVIKPNDVVYNPEHWPLTHPHHHHFVFLKNAEVIGVVQVELVDDKHAILGTVQLSKSLPPTRSNSAQGKHSRKASGNSWPAIYRKKLIRI